MLLGGISLGSLIIFFFPPYAASTILNDKGQDPEDGEEEDELENGGIYDTTLIENIQNQVTVL